jgi:glyoxylase-like metal-dependent hydrolase (beta-lactamase superfamily II)
VTSTRWAWAALTAALLGGTVCARAAQSAAAVSVLQLRPDFYMLTVEGVNIGVEIGQEGVIVVDSGPPQDAQAVLDEIRKIAVAPIRYVIDTSADPQFTGGNAVLSDAGLSLEVGWAPLLQAANHIRDIRALDSKRAPIIARLGVVEQMAASQRQAGTPAGALPTDTFARQEFNFRVNDQAIQVVAMPPAHSQSDSVVLFRGSDVVVSGAIFDDTHFPVIDLQHGGSINGEIDAVNQVMNTLVVGDVPVVSNSGGTWIVPEHGPVCDQVDLLTYRDMLLAVRSRVQALIEQGESLSEVQAADPTQGYETRYGSDSGNWTTRDFVAAVYASLKAGKRTPAAGRRG